MLWKIYFAIMAFVILFSAYYQLIITSRYSILDLINLASSFVLLLGAYSYIFKKKLLDAKRWKLIFKGLLILVGVNILYQVWPSNYLGDFSFLNASLLTNIFAYLLVTSFFIPLYYAIYNLSLAEKPSKKKKSG